MPITTNTESSEYLSGDSIGIVNADKLFNGRSIFSAHRDYNICPIGSVVIDDVHYVIKKAMENQTLVIPSSDAAYEELLELFKSDIDQQGNDLVIDLYEKTSGALAQVPFWSWQREVEKVRGILRKNLESSGLKFSWPVTSRQLELCRAVFSRDELTIAPLHPDMKYFESFHNADHRIYLTATLADDGEIIEAFDADPSNIKDHVFANSFAEAGERMILAPQEMNPEITDTEIRIKVSELAKDTNIVVLCPSNKKAAAWSEYGATVADSSSIEDVVSSLKSGHVGLVALANRYDGVDLPGDACRVLVMDGLPQAFSGIERLHSRVSAAERGIGRHQVQRIEQGMGRAIRSAQDYCVVLLMGREFSLQLSDPRFVNQMSPSTVAQISLAKEIWKVQEEWDVNGVFEVAKQLLDRDEDWIKLAKSRLIEYENEAKDYFNNSSAKTREAYNYALDRDYAKAAALMGDAANVADSDRQRGWLLEERAIYQNFTDEQAAQGTLKNGRKFNPYLLFPREGIGFRKERSMSSQSTAILSNLRKNYCLNDKFDANKIRLECEAIKEDLRFDPERTNEFEAALSMLGCHLGFVSTRPELEYGVGPDNFWGLGSGKFWVIEAKSGATSSSISKSYVNQLNGSIEWFKEEYNGSEYSVVPVMVHPSRDVNADAYPKEGTKIISEGSLQEICSNLIKFYQDIFTKAVMGENLVEFALGNNNLAASMMQNYLKPFKRLKK